MGSNDGFGDDPMAPGCYSQLLFSNEIPGLDPDGCLGFTSLFSSSDGYNRNSQRMLQFGDYSSHSDVNVVAEDAVETSQKSGVGFSDPGTLSPKHDSALAALPKTTRKRAGSGSESGQAKSKKSKCQSSSSAPSASGHAKVGRKERLGERVTILQQLVSPFGKTDTASVLHEAFGYIRFLQDQIQVLSSPYLHRLPVMQKLTNEEKNSEGERKKDDLRSRGLCLVPVELSLHVAEESNGADIWSSSAAVFGN